jgi:hypothetical protein
LAKKTDKQPKRSLNPNPTKQVKQREHPEIDDNRILWSFAMFDHCAAWATDDDSNHFCSVAGHLKSKQSQPWSEIRGNHARDHLISIAQLSKPAQDRLEYLGLDDFEELISFHFTGKQRIFGLKVGCIFQVLWWDPDHRVCPAPLRHT